MYFARWMMRFQRRWAKWRHGMVFIHLINIEKTHPVELVIYHMLFCCKYSICLQRYKTCFSKRSTDPSKNCCKLQLGTKYNLWAQYRTHQYTKCSQTLKLIEKSLADPSPMLQLMCQRKKKNMRARTHHTPFESIASLLPELAKQVRQTIPPENKKIKIEHHKGWGEDEELKRFENNIAFQTIDTILLPSRKILG